MTLTLIADAPHEISLGDVLAFITGADALPPLGFDKEPTIQFFPDRERLPNASTCIPSLRLPRSLTEYYEFKDKITLAILGSGGFGNV